MAIASLSAVVFIAVPWVDEYSDLQRGAAEMDDLEGKLIQSRQRRDAIAKIETKLDRELGDFQKRNVTDQTIEAVRENLIEMVRTSGARLRRLEISDDEPRTWAQENDDARREVTPLYAQDSGFLLHAHVIELHADGSLAAIEDVFKKINLRRWLFHTRSMNLSPAVADGSVINLELRMVVHGLSPNQNPNEDDTEDYAMADRNTDIQRSQKR